MTINLQDLISAVEQAGDGSDVTATVGQVLADNPDADLAAIAAEAQSEFQSIDLENPTDESIGTIEALVAIGESVKQASDAAEAATAERAATLASLSDRMGALGATNDDADDAAEPDDETEEPAEPAAKAAGGDAKKKVSTAQSDTDPAAVDARPPRTPHRSRPAPPRRDAASPPPPRRPASASSPPPTSRASSPDPTSTASTKSTGTPPPTTGPHRTPCTA